MSNTVHTAVPPAELMDWLHNEGDYGDGGPDCHSGFRSPCIKDANGQTILDTLNSDGAMVEEEFDGDEDNTWHDAWDEAGRKRVKYIVRAVNLHESTADALAFLIEMAEYASQNLDPEWARKGGPGQSNASDLRRAIEDAQAAYARATGETP